MAGEGWTWDESLYAGSAAFYAAGRMPYPPELVEAMREGGRSGLRDLALSRKGSALRALLHRFVPEMSYSQMTPGHEVMPWGTK